MYELSYLISGAVDEANVEKVAQTIEKEIKEIKGEIINKVAPVKRKLCYPINKQGFAYFATLYFEAPKNNFQEINQFFKLNDNILRHLIVESTESAMKDYLRRQKTQESGNRNEEAKSEEKTEEKKENVEEKIEQEPVISSETNEEPQDSSPVQTDKKEEIKEVEKQEKEAAEKAETETKIEEKKDTKKKIDLEDIDKQIDEILNKTEI